MSNSKQFPAVYNFMMLTNKLHRLFLQYIVDGRRRAPPIIDLSDLVSSFQLGARTDRRALQSKFKSWARRMIVVDGKLMLESSNKEIIPLEKCDDLVMCIHSEGHKSIDQVVSKIREKYTWMKKNFGMDRVMVMNYILRNCSNLECKRKIEMEISERDCCDNFIKNVVLASESQAGMFQNQEGFSLMNKSLFNRYSSLLSWPLVFPFATNSMTNELSFSYNLPKIEDVKSLISNENKPYFTTPVPINFQNGTYYKSSENEAKNANIPIQRNAQRRKRKFGTFRKPKHIREFKLLISAAEQLNDAYPSILTDPKTVFLGGLDLAPKKICSKRTLLKFQKEKKRKSILEKQHLLHHKNRKNLRDRNKLNKIKLKQEQEKRAYLEVPGPQKKSSPIVTQESSKVTFSERKQDDNEIEIVKVVPSKNEPEVILITSSDDESPEDKGATKYKSSIDIKVVNSEGKGNFSKIDQNGNKHVEVVSNNGMSSLNDASSLRLTNQYTHHPVLRKVLLPSSIKGEIAVLPFSRHPSPKSLSQVYSTGNRDFNVETPTKINSILKPFPNKIVGSKPAYFNKLSTGQHLPESKYLLFKKTENGKVIPREQLSASFQLPGQLNGNSSTQVEVVIGRSTTSPTAEQTEKERVVALQKTYARTSQNPNSKDQSVHEEMSKLLKWIKKTKITMSNAFFNHQVERSTRKLESDLNAGITLIRTIRRKLLEVERVDLNISTKDG